MLLPLHEVTCSVCRIPPGIVLDAYKSRSEAAGELSSKIQQKSPHAFEITGDNVGILLLDCATLCLFPAVPHRYLHRLPQLRVYATEQSGEERSHL